MECQSPGIRRVPVKVKTIQIDDGEGQTDNVQESQKLRLEFKSNNDYLKLL